jgi:RHS repeat-associated protein
LKADYTYDGLERMALRTTQNMTPSGTTHYVYDLAGHLVVEASDTGATLREYIWLDDLPLAVVADVDTASPNLYFVHADQLDRPIKMTDGGKAIVWDAVYRPFGEAHAITGTAANNLRFPGQYFLIESGLHYNWHRHYDPTLGRYTQPDPLGFVDGSSVYAYGSSSPTMRTDPTGEFGVLGFIISGGLNLGGQIAINYVANGGNLGQALRCVDISNVVFSGLAGAVGLGFGNFLKGTINLRQYAAGVGIGAYLKNFYPPIPVTAGSFSTAGSSPCECRGGTGLGNALKTIIQ